jgi:hypothetical protein
VQVVRLRWIGHRLTGAATIETDAVTLHDAAHVAAHAHEHAHDALRNLDDFTVTPVSIDQPNFPRARGDS